MATPNVGILTTAGKALIDKVNSGQAKISFSKVVFSSMDNSQLSDTQIKALTAIAPQEVVVSSPETTLDTNSGETRIRATGTNEKLADGVYVKTYVVFAKDDTGNEILYGVTVSPNPNYFPAYDGVTPQAVTYSYKTVIQETSNITMTNSNDVYVSQEDLTEAIAKIPKPDLGNYATKDEVATKADTSAIDPSGLLGAIPITSTTDLFTLDPGIYFGNNVTPVNGPAINSLPTTNYFWVRLETPKANASIKKLTWTDNGNHQYFNEYYGVSAKWHDWQVPNSTTMASKSDVTTAISTATANMADTTKDTNFPGLKVQGVDVATAADLKSIEDSAWREITNPAFKGSYLFRDNQDGTASIAGTIYFTKPTQQYNGYDDYVIPMPDGYKAVGVASSGNINGFINDYSLTVQELTPYFPGSALHLYSTLSQNRQISIPLCSIIISSGTSITSNSIILNVVKSS